MSTWVFTHGSLMAHPPFAYQERRQALVHGRRRTFGHPSVRNWGRPDHPAPTCSLVPGDMVAGVAYLVTPAVVADIQTREASDPVSVEAEIDGTCVDASTWVMTDTWAGWSPVELAVAARANIAGGGGPFGDADAYLRIVRKALAGFGLTDPAAERYAVAMADDIDQSDGRTAHPGLAGLRGWDEDL